jgi:hypothetical protein
MMAHNLSAAEIKHPDWTINSQQLPKEGTKTRKVYDLLMENRGRWVDISPSSFGIKYSGALGSISEALMNSYGLDIRKGYGKWLLAGEWFGKVYIDYVVEQ